MSKTSVIVLVVGATLVFVAVIFAFLFLSSFLAENKNFTRENFDKIKLEQTRKEVEAILGTGKEVTLEETNQHSSGISSFITTPEHSKIVLWQRGGKHILVYFKDDKVVGMRSNLKPEDK